MDRLGFLLSKKILVVLSGVMFTGVAFASSGAGSLLQNSSIITPETKIPEVQQIAAEESPAPALSSVPGAKIPASVNNTVPKTIITEIKPAAAFPAAAVATPKPAAVVPLQQAVQQTPIPTPTAAAIAKSPAAIAAVSQDREEEDEENGEKNESDIKRAFRETDEDDD